LALLTSSSLCLSLSLPASFFSFFFSNAPATTEFYPLSLHDALPILVAFPRQEDEIVDGYRRVLRIQRDADRSLLGLNVGQIAFLRIDLHRRWAAPSGLRHVESVNWGVGRDGQTLRIL